MANTVVSALRAAPELKDSKLFRKARYVNGECIQSVSKGTIRVATSRGVKKSGLGREGSKCGMAEFLEIKYLCLGRITGLERSFYSV
jgi:hypothetical protein